MDSEIDNPWHVTQFETDLDEIAALRATVARLRAALAPLAALAPNIPLGWGDAFILSVHKARVLVGVVDVSDVRRAVAALAGGEGACE